VSPLAERALPELLDRRLSAHRLGPRRQHPAVLCVERGHQLGIALLQALHERGVERVDVGARHGSSPLL
jgi:hypothetical protein